MLIDDTFKKEDAITLPYKFIPRDYQKPMFQALVPELFPSDKAKRVDQAVVLFHRRAGKDKCAINVLVCRAMIDVGVYLYVAPQASQARKIIWNGIGSDGMKFIDHIPHELIQKKLDQEMYIELINGSTIQVAGADNYDSLVGTNPIGIVFSEYSLQNPAALQYFRPMLVENGGWSLFIYTFRGRNHGYDLYKIAKQRHEDKNPNWFCQLETIETTTRPDGTPVVTRKQFEQEIKDGMPEATAKQEYYCDPNQGNVGAYYADQMTGLYEDKAVGRYPHDPAYQVVTSWDLGINDNNSIWFAQVINGQPRLIDYESAPNVPMVEWIAKVRAKKYNYYAHIAPHDIKVRDSHTGIKRIDQCADLGFHFDVAPKISVAEGVSAVRTLLPICVFNDILCEEGVEALMGYQRKYDPILQNFSNSPLHDKHSHGADAFRYFAVMFPHYKHMDEPLQKFKVKRALR